MYLSFTFGIKHSVGSLSVNFLFFADLPSLDVPDVFTSGVEVLCILQGSVGTELIMASGEKNDQKKNISGMLTLCVLLLFVVFVGLFSCQSAVDDSEPLQSCNFLRVHWQR